ncbi:hypothetical protein D9M68_717560 [compost metagenome]
MGQRLEVEAAGDRHHRHQQLALLAGGEQRLEHARRVEAELFRGFQAVGRRLGVMGVAVDGVFSLGFFQQVDGGGHVR